MNYFFKNKNFQLSIVETRERWNLDSLWSHDGNFIERNMRYEECEKREKREKNASEIANYKFVINCKL